jgi:hypothetical protein
MRRFWIIGGGRFGLRAAEAVRRVAPGADFLIVEKNLSRCQELQAMALPAICAEGIDFLIRNLESPRSGFTTSDHARGQGAGRFESGATWIGCEHFEGSATPPPGVRRGYETTSTQRVWIVAAAPVHVAYEWVRTRLSESSRFEPYELPADDARLLPNALAGAGGQMFASNADFICPPDCSEAGRLCTATGRPRPRRMHAFLRDLPCPGVKKIIVRSFQLAPGVGALRASDLFSALEEVRAAKTPILFATACKCHAVMNSFRVIR